MLKPSKIICVGLNYKDHADELGMQYPEVPILFMKPNTSIIYEGDEIIMPSMSERVDYEAELAIVIGKKCKDVSEKDALEYVEGFTCLNDVTARDLQKKDGQWTRAKSFDTFCPIGPKVVKLDEPNNVDVICRVNGEVKQKGNTNNMVFSVEKLISFISKIMTLEEGDIISTGTPSGIGPFKEGDVVEIEIPEIGVLRNKVVKR